MPSADRAISAQGFRACQKSRVTCDQTSDGRLKRKLLAKSLARSRAITASAKIFHRASICFSRSQHRYPCVMLPHYCCDVNFNFGATMKPTFNLRTDRPHRSRKSRLFIKRYSISFNEAWEGACAPHDARRTPVTISATVIAARSQRPFTKFQSQRNIHGDRPSMKQKLAH